MIPKNTCSIVNDEDNLVNELIWSDTKTCLSMMVVYNLENSTHAQDRLKVGEIMKLEDLRKFLAR